MILAVLFAATQFYAQPGRKVESDIEKLVPKNISGWTAPADDSVYSSATLHQYIDGASEIYRALNVQRVVARRYIKQGFPQITADIFKMKSPADAFGAYHHDIRDGADPHIGRESEYDGASLAFWKDRYVVYVTAAAASEPVKAAIFAIGEAAANAIPSDGDPPSLLDLLPPQGLLSADTRYFHNHFLLNLYYYVSEKNLLNLDSDTEGVMARYKTPDGPPMTCLIIRYPAEAAARAARSEFLRAYLPDAGSDDLAQTENARWTGIRMTDKLLCVVFDAPAKADAIQLMDKIAGPGGTSK
ncbi:MAG: hypothetical protein NTZ09_02240 [Candidatus Hydrogenedentes bacterium]|nr:hypothetical protein [Candidatus Hydrogenedentota bacterium]